MKIHNLIIGDGILGFLLLEDCIRRTESTVLVRRASPPSPEFTHQTWHSQGVLHSGLRYRLENDNSGAWASYLNDWANRRGNDGYGTYLRDLRQEHLLHDGMAIWAPDKSNMDVVRERIRDECSTPERHGKGWRTGVNDMVLDTKQLLKRFMYLYRRHIVTTDDPPFGSLIDTVILEGMTLEPRHVYFAAGGGNEKLLQTVTGKLGPFQQFRPTHMVQLAGTMLTEKRGYIMHGGELNLVLTSDRDALGRVNWYLGGRAMESLPGETPEKIYDRAAAILESVFDYEFQRGKLTSFTHMLPTGPAIKPRWGELHAMIYPVSRFEGHNDGVRPDKPIVQTHGKFVAGWPTKLVMAPRCAKFMTGDL